jgi:lipopolysaccharide export system permease protein
MTTQVLIRVDVLTTTGQAIRRIHAAGGHHHPSVISMVAPFAF